MSETVTVGIPTLNSMRTIQQCVSSLFAQDHEDWLAIIVDDGSCDGTRDYLLSLDDDRVTVVCDGLNRGLAARLNQLAHLCQTSLLFRMDSDDIMHPRRLSIQATTMQSRPRLDVLGSRAYAIGDDSEFLGLFREPPIPAEPRLWLKGCALTHPTVVSRTSFSRENPYDESLLRAEDLDLFLRVAQHASLAKLETPLLFYRIPFKTSAHKYRESKEYERRVIRRHARRYVSSWEATYLIARSRLKEELLGRAASSGFHRRYQAQRFQLLEHDQSLDARQALAEALSVCVPRR